MTTDTLIEVVLDEAESIVRAEWMRLLDAALSDYFTKDRAEMPAARPRPPRLYLRTGEPRWRGTQMQPYRAHRRAARRRGRRGRPTQRSPPWHNRNQHLNSINGR